MKPRPDAHPAVAPTLRELTDSRELHQLVRSLYVHALRLGASPEASAVRAGTGTDSSSHKSDRHQAGPHVDRTPSDESAVKFPR